MSPRESPAIASGTAPSISLKSEHPIGITYDAALVTADGSLSAQFEHTIVITDHGPEILSQL